MTTKQHGKWMYNCGVCECDICHDEYLAYKRELYRRAMNGESTKGELVHGTTRGYNYYGCRCSECLSAKRNTNLKSVQLKPKREPKPKKEPKIRIARRIVTFPTPEERANRKIEWAGIAL